MDQSHEAPRRPGRTVPLARLRRVLVLIAAGSLFIPSVRARAAVDFSPCYVTGFGSLAAWNSVRDAAGCDTTSTTTPTVATPTPSSAASTPTVLPPATVPVTSTAPLPATATNTA